MPRFVEFMEFPQLDWNSVCSSYKNSLSFCILNWRKVGECVTVRRPGRAETAETRNSHCLFSREHLRRLLRKKAAVVKHLQIYVFTLSHLQIYIFTPSHLQIYIVTPSHLQIYIFTPSHLQIYIFTLSHLLIYIFTPSHLLIYIFTPSHLQI